MIVEASKTIFLLAITVLPAAVPGVMASEWGMFGSEDDWQSRAAEVNEGELRILQPRTDLHEHHHHIELKLTQESLQTGWVDMMQCHTNLDAVSALQIVFREGKVRHLRIDSYSKIAKVWVEKNTVQLEDISPDSRICLSLKTRALNIDGEKMVLKNGPFMRRFLDGYYPMRVSMQIEYPTQKIRYIGAKPENIVFRADNGSSWLEMDIRFEGRLNTVISFQRVKPGNQ